MQLFHDSYLLRCREPLGAQPCDSVLTLRLYGAVDAQRATLRFYDGSEKWINMTPLGGGAYEAKVKLPDVPMLCWYDFRAVDASGVEHAYGSNADQLGGEGVQGAQPRGYQVTVYAKDYQVPEYMRTGVMYQIFPDRFYRSHPPVSDRADVILHENWDDVPLLMPNKRFDNCAQDFFGGDLKGIQEKLPYLSDLGVTVLYLNPIFLARSNHRYDTADYTRVDPILGHNQDFIDLCQAAKAQGIRILLDGVFSHTGEDSLYFNRFGTYDTVGAYQSQGSPYATWYTFTEFPHKYRSWWGIEDLPELNKNAPSLRAFMLGENGVARQWIRRGAAGWRLDVADELPMGFLRDLRSAVKEQAADALLLGEVWEDASHKEAYGEMRCYCLGDTLDSVMNYPLREAIIDFLTGRSDAHQLRRLILSQRDNYAPPFYYSLMNLAGSHDRARAINVLCGHTFEELPVVQRGGKRLTPEQYALGRQRYVQMIRILTALPGVPCIYYGDEMGVQGAPDPYCRSTFPWQGGDKSLHDEIRGLLHQRRARRVLQTGALEVDAPDENTLVITRSICGGLDALGDPAENDNFSFTFTR